MNHHFRTLLLLIFAALVLTGCGSCTEADLLTRPVQVSPPNHTLVGDLRPVLTWTYEACSPTEFIINLWTNATNGTTADTGFGGPTGSSDESWSPSVDLEIGTAYIWQVAAKNGTIISPYSPFWEFIVGPACDAVDLIAPDPVGPSGAGITTLTPNYVWDYTDPACTPGGYALQVSTNSDFTALVINSRLNNPIKAWMPSTVLSNCSWYYWRVAAIDGPDDGPWSSVLSFRTDQYGNCPCLAAELEQPVAVWPGPYEIIPDLLPILEWSFPGSCEVGGYAVHLSEVYDMSDTSRFGGTGSPNTRWMPATDLDPAMQYWWEVAAGVGTDFGEYSSRRSFFTGPECAAPADLVAPELISPIDGVEVTDGYATLRYKPGEPGCIPDGYFVNLQTDSSFGGTNLLGEFSLPGTTILTDPLDDCTVHYWKVAAIQGGVYGPESSVGSFYTNESGTCPPAPVEPLIPMIRFLQNAFCRKGPGTEYGTAAAYEKGEEVELIGRSEPGRPQWWYTPWRCWVSDSTGETSGPVDELPIYPAPPLPSPTPVPPVCRPDLRKADCEAAGGLYIVTGAAAMCACPQ